MHYFLKSLWGLTTVAFLISGATFAADQPATSVEKAKVSGEQKTPKKKVTTFKGEQLTVIQLMETLFDYSKKVNQPKTRNNKYRKRIDKSIDWHQIAILCLGTQIWKKQGPKNRKAFEWLLKDIISLTAYGRMDDFWDDTRYTFEKVDIKGREALIVSKFIAQEEEYELNYYLHKKGKKWLLYDVAFEDIRYSENISEQIIYFLKEKSFKVLLGKLRKRHSDLLEDYTDKPKPSKKAPAKKPS